MTPTKFLKAIGWVLLVLGVLGFVLPGGVLLPDYLVFYPGENWAHLVLGVVGLLIGYAAPMSAHKPFAVLFGLAALVFGIWGFVVAGNAAPNWYGLVNLDNPLDNIVHLVVGIWGLWAGFSKTA